MKQIGFIGPSYTLDSVNADCQSTINWYPEINELGTGKNQEVARLVDCPALVLNQSVGAGPLRGFWRASNGRLFAVSGFGFYEIYTDGTAAVLRGNLSSIKQRVSVRDNGIQLVIADSSGMSGYLFTFADNSFTTLPLGDGFSGAKRLAYQDGYFLINKPNTQEVYISGIYDGGSWDPLDFASSEGAPDNLLTLESDGQNVWMFGERTTEVWFNSGNPDFPFQRIPGAVLPIGIAAIDTLQLVNGQLLFVAQDNLGHGIVAAGAGQQYSRVSNTAIEREIAKLGDISDSTAWSYQQNGHMFYCLNLTGAKTTWVLDVTSGLWHERRYWGKRGWERHRADCHVFSGNKHLVGDYQNANIYELTDESKTDNGTAFVRERTAPHISVEMNRLFFSNFTLDMETGVGLDGNAQGSDPKVMLCWSNDGGHSWSDWQDGSMGKIGEYRTKCSWRRLGMGRDRVWRVRISDPVKATILSGFFEMEVGA